MTHHIIAIEPYRGADTAIVTEVLDGDEWTPSFSAHSDRTRN